MALTESKLRQIIKEEAKRMMEMDRTPRGMAAPRGEPRDTDTTRGMAHGRGDGGRMQTMGGRDEDFGDDDDFGGGDEFAQKFMKGDRVMVGDQEATVLGVSEVDSAVKIELDSGTVMTIDGDYIEHA